MPPVTTLMLSITLDSYSPAETRKLGAKIGRRVQADTVIALHGELGSGKTVFIQGLARGLDVPENYYVTSPTYTLINEYPGRKKLFHVDLYRLADPIDFENIGLYEILYGKGVVAIEWADRLVDDLPAEHIRIHFEISGNDRRKIRMTAHGLEPLNLLKGFEHSL
jgi:tRNA threonylcarbamoyladenosine biosynthesis protein TsaE